jgi:hypothetical protein
VEISTISVLLPLSRPITWSCDEGNGGDGVTDIVEAVDGINDGESLLLSTCAVSSACLLLSLLLLVLLPSSLINARRAVEDADDVCLDAAGEPWVGDLDTEVAAEV